MPGQPDPSSADSVYVSAEEHAHPALRKLSRALIALARLKQAESANAGSSDITEDDLELPKPRLPLDDQADPRHGQEGKL